MYQIIGGRKTTSINKPRIQTRRPPDPEDASFDLVYAAPAGRRRYQLPGLVVLTVALAVCFVVADLVANVMVGFSVWTDCR